MKFFFSIRYRLLLLISVILVAAMLVYLFLARTLFREDKLRSVFSLNQSLARTTAGEVGSRLLVLTERLQSFARERARAVEAESDTDSVTRDLFEDVDELLRVEVYDRPASASRYERIDGHTRAPRLEKRGMDEDLLDRARRLHPVSALMVESEGVHVQNSSVPPEFALLTIAVPVSVVGGAAEVIVADVAPDRLLGIFTHSRIYTLYLVDGRGTVLAHPEPAKVANAANLSNVDIVRGALGSPLEQGARTFVGPDGQTRLGAYSSVGVAHATVVSEIPWSEAISAGEQLLRKSGLFAAWIMLAAFLASLYFSRRMTAPLERLEAAAAAIGQGDFDVEVPSGSRDEIGRLGLSFRRMATDLRDREQRLRDAQSALMQSAKMAAFGQLGAAITHEVKNPLAGILGFAQYALGKLDDPALVKEAMETIAKESQRCKEIVEKFLKLARQDGRESFSEIDVNAVVEETLKVVKHHFQMNRVRVEATLAPALPHIRGSAGQLQQVFLNVLLNAQDAMPNGGTVRLSTERGPDGRVAVQIADSGTGISPEIRQKIFEPFFTTKGPGRGTGLGLSVSMGIVREHAGAIDLETQVGQGTTFTIRLPTIDMLPPRPASADPARPAP